MEWTTSVLEGVAAGLTVALILGVYAKIERRIRAREQKRPVRDMILDCYRKIKHPPTGLTNPPLDPDNLRYEIFYTFIEDLKGVLQDRSPQITYKRKHELVNILSNARSALNIQGRVTGVDTYNMTFSRLQELSWLGLIGQPLSLP